MSSSNYDTTSPQGSHKAPTPIRYPTLDGWRGVSILLVLAGHLLPIGPKALTLNGAVAASGMAIFFALSGFLITSMLLHDDSIVNFLIRRLFRILPLAWLCTAIVFFVMAPSNDGLFRHLTFTANWLPIALFGPTSHFWSLCVEVQFYVLMAAIVALLRHRAFFLLPILCIGVTLFRYYFDVQIAINTHFRLDEILSGCILALIFHNKKLQLASILKRTPTLLMGFLLVASAHPASGALNYFRPYIAAAMIGSTLFGGSTRHVVGLLNSKFLGYMAQVSFAVYLIHGLAGHTWLGSGETLEKYIKRPLLFVVTFALAHLSTFHFERHFIDKGRRLIACRAATGPEAVVAKP